MRRPCPGRKCGTRIGTSASAARILNSRLHRHRASMRNDPILLLDYSPANRVNCWILGFHNAACAAVNSS